MHLLVVQSRYAARFDVISETWAFCEMGYHEDGQYGIVNIVQKGFPSREAVYEQVKAEGI